MPQKISHTMLITKTTIHDGKYVFPGDTITAPNLTLAKMGKAVVYDEKTMKDEPKKLKEKYAAEKAKRGAIPAKKEEQTPEKK